ncbi:MAG TPA: glycosyltransferase family 2 protein [Thermoanaerobaculia bacterium]|jgi:GT2 family glycosyltransferase|nr:glycosyltransferase family 2 protein [Thermoanaerobaculia bacterium]
MEPGLVSVVLVTWNSAPFLRRCLEGIRQQTQRTELIVVDNGSADHSLSLIGQPATIIRNEDNRGFSAAVNQGLRVARGEFVLLCNPDAYLLPDYAARLAAALQGQVGMATGKLLHAEGFDITPTNIVDTKGIRMTRSGRHFDIEQGLPDRDGEETREVFGVSGAAAMYTRAFLDDVAVGGEVFDEDFHTYREDADLSWRGRIFGWKAVYVPAAVGYHVRTVTPATRRTLPPFVNMHSVKNRFLLRLKNQSLWLALRNAPFELPRDLVAIGAVLTIERTSLPALRWLWKNRRRVMAKRRDIQRRRRVSDRELAKWFR